MKIIQVIPLFEFGGAEIMCENLTYELIKSGHEVIVVSLYKHTSPLTERLIANGVDLRYMDKKPGLDLTLVSKLKKLFSEEKPDAVHTHLYVTKYVFPAAKAAKVPSVVHTVHSIAKQENSKMARRMNKWYFKHGHAVPVALSKRVQDTVIEEYKLPKEKIPVIYNGVKLSNCVPKTSYACDGTFKILHIGRFCEVKNHKGLLEAFKMFHEKYEQTELWLIGDGATKSGIESATREYGLENAVTFFGNQSYVFDHLSKADIFTLPSLYEGIPMTLAEAMGTGLPIVATAVGGVPDMLNAESAQLIEVNAEKLARAFEAYYSDESLREKHGKNALGLSVNFSAQTMSEEYCKVYLNK